MFETGTNQWKKYDEWPPPSLKQPVALSRAKGALAFRAVQSDLPGPRSTNTSDPAHPVEYIDRIEIRMTGDYMIQDQRVAARRPDVLVYERDRCLPEFTISGPIEARLFVSTSGTDSDWIVKLIDVYPDDIGSADTEPAGHKARRLSATRPRRRDARQVSQQPRKARAVRARQADAR